MALGSFTGRKPPRLTEFEIALNAHQLEETWNAIGPLCVKRRYGDYGIALLRSSEARPVWVYPRAMAPDPLTSISEDATGVETFADWSAAAEAGWQVD